MDFKPDYRNIVAAAKNNRPPRLPIYEHHISPAVMEKILDKPFADLQDGDESDLNEFYTNYCRFFKEMTYDTVSFEVGIVDILPGHGAIMGYGVMEISEDLIGFEYLSYLQADDPELFVELYRKIGDLMARIWRRFLDRYSQYFCVYRFGDDLGFKTGTLLALKTITTHIIPQYRRLISMIHNTGKPFLWHCCGNIFEIMDYAIDAGIDAKHSNEDQIAPFEKWIELYGRRIGLLGGIDVDILCQISPDEIYEKVLADGRLYRDIAKGFALGSGNSIPDYVPAKGYLAMIKAARQIRQLEEKM